MAMEHIGIRGMHCVNRIGYIILSENIDVEDINSYKELNKIATYDDVFDKLVREKLSPVADKCYVFFSEKSSKLSL